jgi:hypothetical protein
MLRFTDSDASPFVRHRRGRAAALLIIGSLRNIGVAGIADSKINNGEGGPMLRKLLLIACALALAACTSRPVMNVAAEPVVVTPGKTASADNVRDAILRAGAGLGWHMQPMSPGVVRGTIALRGHGAEINVKYTAKSYDIVYVNSTNLNAENGQIHKNYNGWIENLNRAIQRELLRI